jgi:MFS family permease
LAGHRPGSSSYFGISERRWPFSRCRWFGVTCGSQALGWPWDLASAQGLANVLFAPLMVVLLTNLGWRWAFWGPGIVGGLLLLLLVRFFRNEPAEIGLRPLGADPKAPIQPVQSGPRARIRTTVFLRQARRTFAFWNLIGIHYWGCAGHAIIVVYLADMVRTQGLSLATGALVVSTMFGVSSFTRFAVPILADRAGSKPAMALCFFLQALPIALLFWAYEAWHFYLFAVLFGIGFGGEMSASSSTASIMATDGSLSMVADAGRVASAWPAGPSWVGCCVT